MLIHCRTRIIRNNHLREHWLSIEQHSACLATEQAPLDILEDGELPEESMEVTQTVAVVPPTPTAGTGRVCDGWGREQENCADRTSQTSQTRSDSAHTRQVQVGNKGMFVKVNRPSSSVEGHPYIHWYTQRAFVNLLAESKKMCGVPKRPSEGAGNSKAPLLGPFCILSLYMWIPHCPTRISPFTPTTGRV